MYLALEDVLFTASHVPDANGLATVVVDISVLDLCPSSTSLMVALLLFLPCLATSRCHNALTK